MALKLATLPLPAATTRVAPLPPTFEDATGSLSKRPAEEGLPNER